MGMIHKKNFVFSFRDTQRSIETVKKLIYSSEKDKDISSNQREIYIGLIRCLQGIQQELYSVKVGMSGNWDD